MVEVRLHRSSVRVPQVLFDFGLNLVVNFFHLLKEGLVKGVSKLQSLLVSQIGHSIEERGGIGV